MPSPLEHPILLFPCCCCLLVLAPVLPSLLAPSHIVAASGVKACCGPPVGLHLAGAGCFRKPPSRLIRRACCQC